MKRMLGVAGGIAIAGILLLVVYVINLDFPVEEVKPLSAIIKIERSSDELVQLGAYQSADWYTSKANPAETHKLMIAMMEKDGWRYAEQNGSGLFFENNGEKKIVSCEKWASRYYVCRFS